MKKAILFTVLALAACIQQAQAETPIAAEVSPPGDIPDNQAFVSFSSPAGFTIKVPEGWARKESGTTISFSDKYNHVTLQQGDAARPVDEAFAKASLVPDLQKNGRAVSDVKIKTATFKWGSVVVLTYDSNSEPNAVTNKQLREENETLYFAKSGKQVAITLSAPKGADNVDQWLFMANSFRWK